MAKTKEAPKYDPLKDPHSVHFVQPDEIVEPLVEVDGGIVALDPMPAKEVPSGK